MAGPPNQVRSELVQDGSTVVPARVRGVRRAPGTAASRQRGAGTRHAGAAAIPGHPSPVRDAARSLATGRRGHDHGLRLADEQRALHTAAVEHGHDRWAQSHLREPADGQLGRARHLRGRCRRDDDRCSDARADRPAGSQRRWAIDRSDSPGALADPRRGRRAVRQPDSFRVAAARGGHPLVSRRGQPARAFVPGPHRGSRHQLGPATTLSRDPAASGVQQTVRRAVAPGNERRPTAVGEAQRARIHAPRSGSPQHADPRLGEAQARWPFNSSRAI